MITPAMVRCAVYTRKSSEEGLEQSFNSLHAQREACEAYILSQRHEGWQVIATAYDDGGFSGGSMERPALRALLADIAAKRIDTVVVYKVDRLTRSLTDFSRIVEQFDRQGISFVSVTQQFNTTTSMGRLTLNVLLSFAQFEREVTGERIRDKIAASKRKGMWMGGVVPVGYELKDRQLIIAPVEAEHVQEIFALYLKLGCVSRLKEHLNASGIRSKERFSRTGNSSGGAVYSRGALYGMLHNRVYLGEITHKDKSYPGLQPAIIDQKLWKAVQERFEANLQAPRTKRATLPAQSLLTGLLYDEKGVRFTPSFTIKDGKRYRYYVSNSNGQNDAKAIRLAALEIEDQVLSRLHKLLSSPQRLLAVFSHESLTAPIVTAAAQWAKAPLCKLREVVGLIVERIIVRQDLIEFELTRGPLLRLLTEHDDDSASDPAAVISIVEEAKFSRFRGELRLVLAPDETSDRSQPSLPLTRAVARAHEWMDQIVTGKILNQNAIATANGLNKRYVSKLLPLAFLAPDITEAILEGRQSPQLTLETCLLYVSANWEQQRKALL